MSAESGNPKLNVMSILGTPDALPPTLIVHHRNDFCSRRYSMIKGKPGYGLYDEETGLPSVMHVNMLMWACSPDMKTITKNANKYLEIIKKK